MRREMTATGASGAAACPCSTTQINITWAPVSVHRFTAGSDAIPETRVSQGHTAAPPTPGHAVGAGSARRPMSDRPNDDSEQPDHERDTA